jgi:hypothetical protein
LALFIICPSSMIKFCSARHAWPGALVSLKRL